MGLSNLVDLINLFWGQQLEVEPLLLPLVGKHWLQYKKYCAFDINIRWNVCVYIDGFLWCFMWFIPICSKEIRNTLSSFAGTVFGNKNLHWTTKKFVCIPRMVQHVILIWPDIALPPWLTACNCDPHSFNITSEGCPAHFLMEGNNIYSIYCCFMRISIFSFLLTILKPRVSLSSTTESSYIHFKTLKNLWIYTDPINVRLNYVMLNLSLNIKILF